MNTRDYRRSNQVYTYDLQPDQASITALESLLAATTAAEREKHGAELLASLCGLAGIAPPRLLVLDAPRPHRVRDGRTVYQRYGSYSPRTKTIRLHNRTARLGRAVASATFLETLVHELMHHWDFELLRLRSSLHTSGFYHRLGSVKRRLLEAYVPWPVPPLNRVETFEQ